MLALTHFWEAVAGISRFGCSVFLVTKGKRDGVGLRKWEDGIGASFGKKWKEILVEYATLDIAYIKAR